MATYEFMCPRCLRKGELTQWEMEFRMLAVKTSFCPRCGAKGKQVILTPPMVGSDKGRQYREADRSMVRELEAGGHSTTDITQYHPEEIREAPRPEVLPTERQVTPAELIQKPTGLDLRTRDISGASMFQGAAGATAEQLRINGRRPIDILPRSMPTEAIGVKGEPHAMRVKPNFQLKVDGG